METALTTNWTIARALTWKAWKESRGRFFAALLLCLGLVVYGVLTSPGYLSRHNAHFPDKPLAYSVYVWSGFFSYALQGLWILCAFVLALGGLARERANGVSLYSLGLPVRPQHLFLVRAAVASVEAIFLGMCSALLIPVLSSFVGESYPPLQAITFGLLMSLAGLVIIAFGLLLSEWLEGEFTAPVVGLCAITAIFLGYKAHSIPGRNLFDVMSGAENIDPATQLLRALPWTGLSLCLLLSLALLSAAIAILRFRDL